MNRDPNGTQFWTGSLANANGTIYKYNISPVGTPVAMFNSSPGTLLAGVSIFGEIVVSQPTPTPTGSVPPTATTTSSPTSTPTSPGPSTAVPTLSPTMLGLLAAALLATALLLVRR